MPLVAVLVSSSFSLSSSDSGEQLPDVRGQHPGIVQPSWNVWQNELVQSDSFGNATSR